MDAMQNAAGEWANKWPISIHEASNGLSNLSADNYYDATSLDGQTKGVQCSQYILLFELKDSEYQKWISSAINTSNVLQIQKLIIRSCPWELLCESNFTRHTRLTQIRMGAKMMCDNNGAKHAIKLWKMLVVGHCSFAETFFGELLWSEMAKGPQETSSHLVRPSCLPSAPCQYLRLSYFSLSLFSPRLASSFVFLFSISTQQFTSIRFSSISFCSIGLRQYMSASVSHEMAMDVIFFVQVCGECQCR